MYTKDPKLLEVLVHTPDSARAALCGGDEVDLSHTASPVAFSEAGSAVRKSCDPTSVSPCPAGNDVSVHRDPGSSALGESASSPSISDSSFDSYVLLLKREFGIAPTVRVGTIRLYIAGRDRHGQPLPHFLSYVDEALSLLGRLAGGAHSLLSPSYWEGRHEPTVVVSSHVEETFFRQDLRPILDFMRAYGQQTNQAQVDCTFERLGVPYTFSLRFDSTTSP